MGCTQPEGRASQFGSDILTTTGELRWDPQPATLVTPNIRDTPG